MKKVYGRISVIQKKGREYVYPQLFIDIPKVLSMINMSNIRMELKKRYNLNVIFEGKGNRTIAVVESKKLLSEEEKVPVAKFIDDLIVELK